MAHQFFTLTHGPETMTIDCYMKNNEIVTYLKPYITYPVALKRKK